MNVVHLSPEINPIVWGGLGLAVSGITNGQIKLGHDVYTILPYSKYFAEKQIKTSVVASMQKTKELYEFSILKVENEQIYFICFDSHVDTDIYSYSSEGKALLPYQYCQAALDAIRLFVCPRGVDVIHCHDWSFALACYLCKQEDFFRETLQVLSVHNFSHQGIIDVGYALKIGLDSTLVQNDFLLNRKYFSCLRIGLLFADTIITVSSEYRNETLLSLGSYGNEDILNARSEEGRYFGICNGIESEWDPEIDPYLHLNYNAETFQEGKLANRKFYQKQYGLLELPDVPIILACCRITEQKGLQFLLEIIPSIISDCQVVIVGDVAVGDEFGTHLLENLSTQAKVYPGRILLSSFSEKMERESIAAADIFYICSVFEPGGIANLHASKYGVVVVGTNTGGIHDSTVDFVADNLGGTGFLVEKPEASKILETMLLAINIYSNRKTDWNRIIKNSMNKNLSWELAVQKYMRVYADAIDRKTRLNAAPVSVGRHLEPFLVLINDAIVVSRSVYNLRRMIAVRYVRPTDVDIFYALIKSSGLNLAARLFIAITAAIRGEIKPELAVISITWYQAQDVLFTLYGKSYMQFMYSVQSTVKLCGFDIGDILLALLVVFILALCDSLVLGILVLGPGGTSKNPFAPGGTLVSLVKLSQGMLLSVTVNPTICKLQSAGFISASTADHAFQLMGLTTFLTLLISWGKQDSYSTLLFLQFFLFSAVYVMMLLFYQYRDTSHFQGLESCVFRFFNGIVTSTENVALLQETDDEHLYLISKPGN